MSRKKPGMPRRRDRVREAETLAMVLRVEAHNDQHRQPNPSGANPVCRPMLGRLLDLSRAADRAALGAPRAPSICDRCGAIIDREVYDGPCPAALPEQRWGDDWHPPEDGGAKMPAPRMATEAEIVDARAAGAANRAWHAKQAADPYSRERGWLMPCHFKVTERLVGRRAVVRVGDEEEYEDALGRVVAETFGQARRFRLVLDDGREYKDLDAWSFRIRAAR